MLLTIKPSSCFLLALSLLLLLPGESMAGREPSEACQSYIEATMKECRIPGLAVAVVSGDDVFLKGYGVKKAGDAGLVGAHTVFQIGSTTKAFTACLVATLVDEGKMSFDGRVTDYLPDFQLFDPYPTKEVRVRDLLCHRTGLPTTDYLWYFSDLTSSSLLKRVRFVVPTESFRVKWQYQNVMYLAAGQCAANAAGSSWDELLKARIFEPLDMTESGSRLADLKDFDNVAIPHAYANGHLEPVEYASADLVAPAGSIVSTASDMAKWLSLHLDGGIVNGKRVVSKKCLDEMYSPQINLPVGDRLKKVLPEACRFRLYCLGWIAQDFLGEKCLFHTGGIGGMRSFVAIIPERRTGVVVLANSSFCGESAPSAIGLRLLGDYLDKPAEKWSQALIAHKKESHRKKSRIKSSLHSALSQDKQPDLDLTAYTGRYESEIYGPVLISVHSDKLVLTFGGKRVADLSLLGHNTFLVAWRNPLLDDGLVTFCIGRDGRPISAELKEVAVFRR